MVVNPCITGGTMENEQGHPLSRITAAKKGVCRRMRAKDCTFLKWLVSYLHTLLCILGFLKCCGSQPAEGGHMTAEWCFERRYLGL